MKRRLCEFDGLRPTAFALPMVGLLAVGCSGEAAVTPGVGDPFGAESNAAGTPVPPAGAGVVSPPAPGPNGGVTDEPVAPTNPNAMPTSPNATPTNPMVPPTEAPAVCDDRVAGPSPLRRLTHQDYRNTVSDLFGGMDSVELSFAPEAAGADYPFVNRASAQVVSPTLASQFEEAARQIAAAAVEQGLESIAPCAAAARDEACARSIISDFGKRAFRAPVDDHMMEALMGVYGVADDFDAGMQGVLGSILQMPEFLYRVEDAAAPGGKLNSWDVAERLSYLLWNTMPDEALFAAAEAGELQTEAQVSAQVTRMLEDPRARKMVTGFHEQWLHTDQLPFLERNAQSFPDFTPEVGEAMVEELRRFIEHAVFEQGGTVEALLKTPGTFMNGTLAEHYGVDGIGPDFERVEQPQLDGRPAAGLLSQGGLMALLAHNNETSPVERGFFVRKTLLCQTLPPPPQNIDIVVPELQPNQTQRERLSVLSDNPSCGGCHSMMDPIGLGFEHFDAAGRYRTIEAGQPVDASGEIIGSDVPGPFNGVEELAERLSQSRQVEECLATQWFRYSFGREPTEGEACVISRMTDALHDNGTVGLISHVTSSHTFMYPNVSGGTL